MASFFTKKSGRALKILIWKNYFSYFQTLDQHSVTSRNIKCIQRNIYAFRSLQVVLWPQPLYYPWLMTFDNQNQVPYILYISHLCRVQTSGSNWMGYRVLYFTICTICTGSDFFQSTGGDIPFLFLHNRKLVRAPLSPNFWRKIFLNNTLCGM